jgi:lipocalin
VLCLVTPRRTEEPVKAHPSRCLPTGTPPSSAGLGTSTLPGRRGCSHAAAAFGASKALSSLGTGAVASRTEEVEQGWSVALSGDGNTAIVGGRMGAGGVWMFMRNGGVWTQQGNKLVGTGAIAKGSVAQGYSVALSADGNTAIVGGPGDHEVGAAWVFTRSGGAWTLQGNKLVGTGAVFGPITSGLLAGGRSYVNQGRSVALSADGNTAIVGGPSDNQNTGAAWVFTRNGGVWTQQGDKLVGTGKFAGQGFSVALSADGNTAIVGGPDDNSLTGAAWVFTRSGGVWSQQGNKLVGTSGVGGAWQGKSVALSANGNTAVVGGPLDKSRGALLVHRGGVGLQPRRRRLDAARQQAGRHRRCGRRLARLVRRAVRRRQYSHRRRARRKR